MSSPIKLVLSDVDGTLVTHEKVLTQGAITAVQQLRDANILFALTSARPPQGLAMFIEPLGLTTPLAGFNGGLITDTNFEVLEEKKIDDSLNAPIVELLTSHGLSVWVYQGADWYVLDMDGPHVKRESKTCQCEPAIVKNFNHVETNVAKIVGVSDDPAACASASVAMAEQFGTQVLATRSQTYFVDITHPSVRYGVATSQIATIGDMYNDLSMFAVSGLSVAMGDSDDEVKAAALEVTTSNEDEGFANAVSKFILPS
jgi:Cof subfamily protein (haloacid dehalogenase superfamily)